MSSCFWSALGPTSSNSGLGSFLPNVFPGIVDTISYSSLDLIEP